MALRMGERLPDRTGCRPRDRTTKPEVPRSEQTAQPLAVDDLSGRLLQLRADAPVAVGGMRIDDLEDRRAECLVGRPLLGRLRAVPHPVVPRALRDVQRLQASVEPVRVAVRLHESDPLVQSQLSGKKFLRSAISTSFRPSIRSSLPIRSSYSFTSSAPPNTSGPRSRNSRFQRDTVTGCTSYARATSASAVSDFSTSRTTLNLNFGEYRLPCLRPIQISPSGHGANLPHAQPRHSTPLGSNSGAQFRLFLRPAQQKCKSVRRRWLPGSVSSTIF